MIGWVLITLGREVLVAPLPLAILAVAALLVFLVRINPGFVLAGAAVTGALVNVLSR